MLNEILTVLNEVLKLIKEHSHNRLFATYANNFIDFWLLVLWMRCSSPSALRASGIGIKRLRSGIVGTVESASWLPEDLLANHGRRIVGDLQAWFLDMLECDGPAAVVS